MTAKLILGGIYLTPNNNYFVVVDIDAEDYIYFVAWFPGKEFTQQDLLTKRHVIQNMYGSYYINIESKQVSSFFNNGYCGKIRDDLFSELKDGFSPGSDYYNNSKDLEEYIWSLL